jgi:ADP-ribose pyrophosphatase YjhB (NUDIX family)
MPNIRLLAALIACGALCPLAVRADDDPVAPAAAELPSDESREQSGAVIGEIRIDNLDIFDTRLDEEDNAVFRLANWLHIQTRRETIEQQLLFKPGERYSARLLRESERTLRANGYLRDAAIRVEAVHDGVVDIVVATQDVWTLKPGVSFGRKGGRNSSSVGIQETNLLGRGKQFPKGMHSTLAGFVEPGESFEDAVAREVYEEVKVKVDNVTYRSSQPWPFPASVMIGFLAEAESLDFTVNEDELASARWMSREELRPENLPKDGSFFMPRRDSIARRLIEEWLGHEAGPSISG